MVSTHSNKKWLRVAVGIGLPVALFSISLLFLLLGSTPPCIFYELTGLYCIGCGTGRALLCLLHGDFFSAFRFQPLLMISLPLIIYYSAKKYIAFVFGHDILPFPKIKNRFVGIFILVVIIAYWILRNLPFFPFYLLAPFPV